MELREYAERLVRTDELATKLAPPDLELVDDAPGAPLRIDAPGRPRELVIVEARKVKVPPVAGMQDLSQRRRILHALANHELQAAELFAWALLAFPSAPSSFRRGLLNILIEEQQHCQLYLDRLEAHGGHFGDEPVTGHFWNRMGDVKTPVDFICAMGLTFENANLDFAGDYAREAREVGDEETARAIDQVHDDEIRHVAFSWRWLCRWKPEDETPWQTFERTIQYPLTPSRARGRDFDRDARVRAGLDDEFIAALEASTATRPNGRKR